MKTCLICGEQCSTDALTCSKCGEGSWGEPVAPPEPVAPQQEQKRGKR